jgi:hypothetical protein
MNFAILMAAVIVRRWIQTLQPKNVIRKTCRI